MNKKTVVIAFLVFVLFIVGGCTSATNNNTSANTLGSDKYERDFTRDWYEEVISGFGQSNIQTSVEESEAAAEFRVVYSVSLCCDYYYSFQAFDNWMGRFTYMVLYSGDLSESEIVVSESRSINKEDALMIVDAINNNDFWNIPTVHPDEEMGCDGATVFVEGHANGEAHFISMWEPEDHHRIAKIFKAFKDYSKTIAEDPFKE